MRTSLLLGLALALQAGAAPEAPAPPPSGASTLSQVKGADLDLLEEVRRIAAKLERVRGTEFDRPPLAVRVSDAVREEAAAGRGAAILPARRLAARGRAWADLGFGREASPANVLGALARDLEGIGFDPAANRLLVEAERLSGREFEPTELGKSDAQKEQDPAVILMMTGMRPDEPLVAHVLMHVRQRERLGRDCLASTTDGMLAAAAWAEGDANLAALRYLFQEMNIGDDVFEHSGDPGSFLQGDLMPRLPADLEAHERALLDFVYVEGFHRAVERYLAGGFASLDAAMRGPVTTRALLHPERPGGAPADIPTARPPLAGLTLEDEDVLGEQAIVVLVSQLTQKDNLGLLAGDGWLGDAVRRWERADGAGVTEWRTRWETARDVEDFVYGIERGLAKHLGSPGFGAVTDGRRTLTVAGRLYEIEVRGTEVLVRVTAPGFVTAPAAPR